MDDSGKTEYMTQDPAWLEDYTPAPAGQRIDGSGGILLPVAGYGRLLLPVDQGIANFKGPAHVLALERVAHVPNPRKHNVFSMKRLAQSLDELIRFDAAVIRLRSGDKSLIFRHLRLANGLL